LSLALLASVLTTRRPHRTFSLLTRVPHTTHAHARQTGRRPIYTHRHAAAFYFAPSLRFCLTDERSTVHSSSPFVRTSGPQVVEHGKFGTERGHCTCGTRGCAATVRTSCALVSPYAFYSVAATRHRVFLPGFTGAKTSVFRAVVTVFAAGLFVPLLKTRTHIRRWAGLLSAGVRLLLVFVSVFFFVHFLSTSLRFAVRTLWWVGVRDGSG